MPHRRCILCGRHWVLPSACSSVVLDKICVTCMWFALCWWLCCVQVHRLCAPRDPLCIGCGCVAIFRHGFNWVLCGTLFVFPLLHCLPPVLRPHWWCLVSTLLRCCIQALICCVLCVCYTFYCLSQCSCTLTIWLWLCSFPHMLMPYWWCVVGLLASVVGRCARKWIWCLSCEYLAFLLFWAVHGPTLQPFHGYADLLPILLYHFWQCFSTWNNVRTSDIFRPFHVFVRAKFTIIGHAVRTIASAR